MASLGFCNFFHFSSISESLTGLITRREKTTLYIILTLKKIYTFENSPFMGSLFANLRFLTSDILETTVFSKPTENLQYQYLERNSAHPLATFKGFIKDEVLQ